MVNTEYRQKQHPQHKEVSERPLTEMTRNCRIFTRLKRLVHFSGPYLASEFSDGQLLQLKGVQDQPKDTQLELLQPDVGANRPQVDSAVQPWSLLAMIGEDGVII